MPIPNMKLEIHSNEGYLCDEYFNRHVRWHRGSWHLRLYCVSNMPSVSSGFWNLLFRRAFRFAITFVKGRTTRTSGQALPYLYLRRHSLISECRLFHNLLAPFYSTKWYTESGRSSSAGYNRGCHCPERRQRWRCMRWSLLSQAPAPPWREVASSRCRGSPSTAPPLRPSRVPSSTRRRPFSAWRWALWNAGASR